MPELAVVGENFDADPSLVSFFQGEKTQWDDVGDLVDSVFDFPFFYRLRNAWPRRVAFTPAESARSRLSLFESKWTPQLGLANGPVMKNGVAQIMLPLKTSEVYQVLGAF